MEVNYYGETYTVNMVTHRVTRTRDGVEPLLMVANPVLALALKRRAAEEWAAGNLNQYSAG